MDKEAIEEAIEVLEDASAEMLTETGNENYYGEAITILRQALETEQEPVAWISEGGDVSRSKRYMDEMGFKCNPLYTAPPKKEWAGLNHFDRTLLRTTYAPLKRLHHIKETKTDIVAEIVNDWDAFFTAIEAKLKEGNTYDAAAAIRSRG